MYTHVTLSDGRTITLDGYHTVKTASAALHIKPNQIKRLCFSCSNQWGA